MVAAAGRGWGVGRFGVAVARVSLHHVPQRGRGDHGVAVEPVARAESDRLAEAAQVWPAVCRQSGTKRGAVRAPLEQEGNTDHGRNTDRAGAGPDRVVVGAVERADSPDVAVVDRPGRTWVLR